MSSCSQCEVLPSDFPEYGTLYLAPPLSHTFGKLCGSLRRNDVSFEQPHPEVVAVAVVPGMLAQVLPQLRQSLANQELRDTRSLVLPDGVTLSIADLMRMRPLWSLIAAVEGRWLVQMLAENRLETHFQPIVSAANPTEIFGYESLLRGRDAAGELVLPGRLFSTARDTDLLFQLDRAARISAIHGAHTYGLDCRVFVNFNPTAIYDATYCLRTTIHEVEQSRLHPEQVVFEVVETEEMGDTSHLLRILEVYRNAGFQVALDDLGSGYGSLNLLARLRPDFVKLDMELIRGVDQDVYKSQVAGKLLELAQELGIKTIAEGIETTAEWAWCRDHGADYAQGYLFARAAVPPPLPTAVTSG
jgi:EAL domain-containing protein (putative c-di-GMP-specific phosphodiesterase class I)